MKAIALTLFAAMLVSISQCALVEDAELIVGQFETFKKTYNKRYASTEEEAKRLGIFIRNMKAAEEQRKRNPKADFGVNLFADLSPEEFKTYHNAEAYYKREIARTKNFTDVSRLKGPQSIDWRNRGAVTQVKNQGQCGSCWSFSSTGNIEGQWAIAGNTLVSLSEQELVSCDTTNSGCNGGLMDSAFSWLINTQGGQIVASSQYPYVSGGGVVPACSMSGLSGAATITSYQDVQHTETAMAAFVGSRGPLSIAVDAASWQSYMGGIMTDCTSSQVDHGVLIVGYDLSAETPYWIIKNSWSASWGEEGYIRVAYGSNQCLITTVPCSSVV